MPVAPDAVSGANNLAISGASPRATARAPKAAAGEHAGILEHGYLKSIPLPKVPLLGQSTLVCTLIGIPSLIYGQWFHHGHN